MMIVVAVLAGIIGRLGPHPAAGQPCATGVQTRPDDRPRRTDGGSSPPPAPRGAGWWSPSRNQPATVIVMWLPLTAALGWIAAVDLDVQRIPNRALGPTAIWVGACLIALAITDHTTYALVHAAIAAAGSLARLHHPPPRQPELPSDSETSSSPPSSAPQSVSSRCPHCSSPWCSPAYSLSAGQPSHGPHSWRSGLG